MTCPQTGEILAAIRDARQALVTPGLASVRHAQECLCTADAALRRVREGRADIPTAQNWEGVRRELSLLEDFVLGILGFFGTALDARRATETSGATGAYVSWSG